MEHHKKFIKDIGILGVVLALSRAKGIILLMMLSKTLGAESYGIWTQIIVTLSFVAPIAILGLPYALIRFLPDAKDLHDTREHVWSTVCIIFAVAFFIILPLLFFPGTFAVLLQTPVSLIAFLAFLIVLESLNSFIVDIFRAFGVIKKYALLSFGLAGGDVLFTAIVLVMGQKLFGAVLALVLIRFVILTIGLILLVRKIGFAIPHFLYVKKYLKFGLPTVAANISHWTVQVSDRYFIATFWGVLFVGYYAPAYTVGLIINLFILPIMLILQPTVSKLFAEKNIYEVKRYLSYSMKYIFFITIPAAFGLVALSRQVLTILSTPEIAFHSSPIVPFVALSIVLYGIYGIFSQVFFLFKKTTIDGLIWMASAVLTLILNFALIPTFGIMGAALATLIAYVVSLVATVIYVSRHLSFPIDWKFAFKTIVASLLMSVIISFFSIEGMLQTVLAAVGGVTMYLIFMLLMKSFGQSEKDFFLAFIKNSNKTIGEKDII